MKNIHKCGSCVFRGPDSGLCRTLNTVVPEDRVSCPAYAGEQNLETCEICGGRVLRSDTFLYLEDRIHTLCGNCAKLTGKCQTCINIKECKFETDPSPIPQVVQKQIRQGPMTQIVQIMNPDRIAITCKMGCDCWDSESESCMKQTCGTCGKYKIVWE